MRVGWKALSNAVISAFVFGTVLVLSAPASAAFITSTFDTDDEGWIANGNGSTTSFVAAGGNLDGHIRVTDITVRPPAGALAPAKFLGDLSAFDGGSLTFDLATIRRGGGSFIGRYGRVDLKGGGFEATFTASFVAPQANNVWTSFHIPLNAADWGKSDAEWAAILADVTRILIVTDSFNFNSEVLGIDNVALREATPVPLPSSLLLLLTAFTGLGAAARLRR